MTPRRRLPRPGAALALLAGAGIVAWLWTPDIPRERLEARWSGPDSAWVSVEGLRLHVRDTGPRDAPAIVLLHGFGASLHTWEPWAQRLAATHRVVRYDQPGAGLTGPDPTGDYGDARSLRVLGALLDRLGLARASLVGHSSGGRLAWRYAAAHPERVDRLVLVAPDGFASPGFAYGRAPRVPAPLRLLKHALPRAALRMALASAWGDPRRLTGEIVSRYHELLLGPGMRAAVLDRLAQTVLEPPEPWLRAIRAPTLLAWGEADGVIPVAHANDYLALIGGSRLVRFPGLGHVPHEEAPAASLPPVQAFLAPSP